MHEPSSSLHFPSPPDPFRPASRQFGLKLNIFVIAVIICLIGGLYYHRHRTQPVLLSKQSITLYYNDGKTVLWQSTAANKTTPPAFAAYVESRLGAMYGSSYEAQGVWRVTTTLDQGLQAAAQKQLQLHANDFTTTSASTTAFAAENVTNGAIVAWISGPNAGEADNVRRPTDSGTLQLPFTYAAFLEHTPNATSTVLNDVLGPLPGWPCTNRELPADGGNCLRNYDQQYDGPITLYQALAGQRLVPAAAEANQLGVDKTLATATAMGENGKCYLDDGLSYPTQCYLSATLGDGLFAAPQSMLQAYATLANAGNKLPQITFSHITLNGKVKYSLKPPAPQRAISAATAKAITAILSDANANHPLAADGLFAARTGTKLAVVAGRTNYGEAASAVQFSDKYAAGFWATTGAIDRPFDGTPESITLPIVYNWMNAAE